MSTPKHTYGPTCHLSHAFTFSNSTGGEEIPTLRAQFFYSSPLPIDDPLTAVPNPSGSESRPTKHAPRPFSAHDNNALEEAWMGLGSDQDRKHHRKLKNSSLKPLTKFSAERQASTLSEVVGKIVKPHSKDASNKKSIKEGSCKTEVRGECGKHGKGSCHECTITDSQTDCSACTDSERMAGKQAGSAVKSSKAGTPKKQDDIRTGNLEEDDTAVLHSNEGDRGPAQGDAADDNSNFPKQVNKTHLDDAQPTEHQSKGSERNNASQGRSFFKKHLKADPSILAMNPSADEGSNKNVSSTQGASEIGTTGFPFQRAPSRRGDPSSRSQSSSPSIRDDTGKELEAKKQHGRDLESPSMQSNDPANTIHVHHCKTRKNGFVSVPVGISRLHLVKLPALQMMPIYWSPVHDIATVIRGTWFYKDTMYPVEPLVANQLEIGYREMRPWSQTWRDELRSALEVGAAGEEKITHRIWPKEVDHVEGTASTDPTVTAADTFCAARCFNGEVAAVGTVELDDPKGKSLGPSQLVKRFPNCHAIYKDSKNAFILKPSLQPSEYYGRKPLAKIKKGITVGIHVVRGFDWMAWEKLHESKISSIAVKAEEGASVAENAGTDRGIACAACLAKQRKPMVTDLVLVIHGIGQKLSERVESFHFTHAINSFRRSINVELGTDAVQKVLRKDLGGIMVLPVNWRSSLSFEDGGPMRKDDSSKTVAISDFTLKDITPDTIPAVRNLVSDVMLDIPFYMSHHKPKMIEALVSEANRVYRLWCQNNPEFHNKGHVHIIAHSLGSAMALDVLSKQPTSVAHVDLRKKASTKHFEFDTKNLFFAGSPAGFFLLLNKGKLLPRRGRNKPDAEPGDDKEKEIADEAGVFGCLAVDNLYNIMHCNDPVAYRLNAAVDPLYAATLKNAQVPSASTGWLEAIGNAVRGITPGLSKAPELGVGQVVKPPVARLPSQLEMEVHDFSREEIAEKKFYLLNDNGQIDYFLSSGGGPLEIQYFNMLSAHSSYWSSADFIRMIVTEIGRELGRYHTLPNMKVMKASKK